VLDQLDAGEGCTHSGARGDETLAEIGCSYNVSGWTISRLTA
jgi:hypothetical protein